MSTETNLNIFLAVSVYHPEINCEKMCFGAFQQFDPFQKLTVEQ